MSLPEERPLELPWEGIESLRTVLGIVDDHELKVDDAAKSALERKLHEAPQALGPIASGDEDRNVSINVSMPGVIC